MTQCQMLQKSWCNEASELSETVLYMLLSHKLEKRQINKNACCFLLPCQILYYIHITQRKCIGIGPQKVLPSRICKNIGLLDKYSIRSQDPDNAFDSETSFLVYLQGPAEEVAFMNFSFSEFMLVHGHPLASFIIENCNISQY